MKIHLPVLMLLHAYRHIDKVILILMNANTAYIVISCYMLCRVFQAVLLQVICHRLCCLSRNTSVRLK